MHSNRRSIPIRLIFCVMFGGTMAAHAGIAPGASSLRPLTPADAIATTRFMSPGRDSKDLVSISPDGRRYVIRLVRGDPQKHGLWVDVLSGSLDSLQAAVPITAAHLFSTGRGRGKDGYGGPVADSQSWYSPITWINDRQVAFLFSDAHEVRQIVTVDLISKRVVFETHAPIQIQSFDRAPDGTLVYVADLPPPPRQPPPTTGFVVPEKGDAMSIAEGFFDGSTTNSRIAHAVWFVQRPHHDPERISFGGRADDGGLAPWQKASLSTDGTHAILTAPASSVPVEWDRFLGHTDGYDYTLQPNLFKAARADPAGWEAGDVRQLYLVDVASHTATPLWNAVAPYPDWRASWAPGGRYVLLTPIPVPIAEQSETGTDAQAVIFDIFNHEHWVLPEPPTKFASVTWISGEEFAIESREQEQHRSCYSFVDAAWLPRKCDDPVDSPTKTPKIRVQVIHGLSTPPKLAAVAESGGEEHVLLDPNRTLQATFSLGKVEFLEGTLSTGEHWTATLTLPVNYVPGQRYPLVIQGRGGTVPRDQFDLYAFGGASFLGESGLGPSFGAVYAAQVLAGRGIAVLGFNIHAESGTHSEAETTQRAFEELASRVVAEGVADADRMGITGFSRTGYFAIHALSHSAMRFAAAVVADNVDYSYMQVVLGNNYRDATTAIGAPPFGAGLKIWLERATGFNADAIHAPVLLIGLSGGGAQGYILEQWEILSLLRELHRPVEMYLMPELDAHGVHNPQNPDEVIAVQERTVDWFDFWLNGHEMPGADKAAQYERWRSMKRQDAAADAARPRT
jgi:dienelactone hydrolase